MVIIAVKIKRSSGYRCLKTALAEDITTQGEVYLCQVKSNCTLCGYLGLFIHIHIVSCGHFFNCLFFLI